MKRVIIRRLELAFEAFDEEDPEMAAENAVDEINRVLESDPGDLYAYLIMHPDEVEVDVEDLDDE